ncbi:hypothetical protein ACIQUQ_33340 [Streptomyces sp. NPDC101118]|uniref:hypothetical protein n=1 Tax=Streptomyces sp. NPDC101118 TaxID=3366109 RepID=UPI00381F3E9B
MAGPESGCRTWWPASQSPQTVGGTARHRVQETAVHTYDAQLAGGSPQPLPVEPALDGVEEFLFTVCATPSASPHKSTACFGCNLAALDDCSAEGSVRRLRSLRRGSTQTPQGRVSSSSRCFQRSSWTAVSTSYCGGERAG